MCLNGLPCDSAKQIITLGYRFFYYPPMDELRFQMRVKGSPLPIVKVNLGRISIALMAIIFLTPLSLSPSP